MAYALRTGLTFCITGGKVIFLDLMADRYFCLAGEADIAFQSLVVAADANETDAAFRQAPTLASLFWKSAEMSPPAICKLDDIPERSIMDTELPVPTIGMAVLAAKSILQTAVMMRYRPLSAGVHALRAEKIGLRSPYIQPEVQGLKPIAAAFEKVRRFTTAHDACLCRSMAMAATLLARKIPIDMVFGVTARPFSAHCWIQHRGVVLNDTLDHVRNYTPILVI